MQRFLLIASCLMSINSASAMTLEGGVEKLIVIEEQKLQSAVVEDSAAEENIAGRIGIRVSSSGYVAHVHPGSPADLAGILHKDKVMLVDGKKNAIHQISGLPDTFVNLEIKRKHETFSLQVKRRRIDRIANN